MKHIDVDAISRSSRKRLDFLTEFVGLTDDDWESLRDSVRLLAPLLPSFLDQLYDHLLSYDDTRRLFLGSDGEVDPDFLSIRKEHLTEWFLETAAGADDRNRFADYLLRIGRTHTAASGDELRSVPPRYIVAMMAYLQSLLAETISSALPLEVLQSRHLMIAWNKMLMIQLEFFLKAMVPEWPEWDERSSHA